MDRAPASRGLEVEIKLELTPSEVANLQASRWLAGLDLVGDARRQRLVSVYFDTPKHRLRDDGVSLRVRHEGARRLQTVKAQSSSLALARIEREREIQGDVPQLRGESLVSKKLAHKLRPIFETRVERTTQPVRLPGGTLEVSIDQGEIVAGNRRQSISEVELELKAGDPIVLTELAKRLSAELKPAWGARSKAERGYALAERQRAQPAKAELIELDPRVTVSGAFPIIGLSCLRQCALNQPLVQAGDAEGVHQMRVGLRRLRAAISLFDDLLGGPETQTVKARLRWLTEQLGPTRDYDVFLDERVLPSKKSPAYRHQLEQLEGLLRAQRAREAERARRAVVSDRYRQLLLETALWLHGGAWTSASRIPGRRVRQQSLRRLACAALANRRKRLVRGLRRLDELQPVERHKLRILVKKLHYGSEFFASLFYEPRQQRRRRRYVAQLERLQDLLGELNDIRIHQTLAEGVVRAAAGSPSGAEAAFAVGLIDGAEQTRAHGLVKAAGRAGRKFAGLPRFWD